MNPDQNQPGTPWPPQQPGQSPEPPIQPQAFNPQPAPAQPVAAPQAPVAPVQPQPAYQNQPYQPSGPIVAPMGGGYPGGPAPLPPRKSKKGLIITLISVGAALIIAAVFIILYFTLWTVRPQDYKAAADTTNGLSSLDKTSRDDLDKIINPGTSQTAEQLTEASDKASKSLSAYEDAVKKLDSERALRDDSIKKLYDTYKDKLKAYTDFANNYLESAKIGRAAILACSDYSKKFSDSDSLSYDDYKKLYLDPCKAELSKASNIKDEDLKKVINGYSTYLDDSAPAVKKVYEALSAKDYSAYTSAAKELQPISTKFSDISKDASDNIKKRYDATKGTTDASDDLLKALNAKAN